MSKQKRTNKLVRGIAGLCSLTGVLLILVVVVLCAAMVVPEFCGYRIYNVVTGSMAPTIPAGSLIYVSGIEAKEVQEDEVIAYYSSLETGGVITHRVLENDLVNGYFITKGDANEKEDPTPVPYEHLIGEVVLSVPVLGNILTAITTENGRILSVVMVALGAILNMLGNYVKSKNS